MNGEKLLLNCQVKLEKIDGFLELDISSTITTLAYLRKAIIIGGSEVYAQRLKDDFDLNKESIEAFDQELERCKIDYNEQSREASKNSVSIEKLSRDDYLMKFARVKDCNDWIANFSGVLEFEESKRNSLEKEAEACQSEVFKLMQLWWKKKVNDQSRNGKKAIDSIVKSVIIMSEVFNPEELVILFDPDSYNLYNIDVFKLIATFVKYNQVIEEYTKLMSSDSPYIANFYMKHEFSNVFTLYHWYRRTTPIFEELKWK